MVVAAPSRNALARRWFRREWKLGQNAPGRNTGGRWHRNAGVVRYAAPACTTHGPNARSICVRPSGWKLETVSDFACTYLDVFRIWGRTHLSGYLMNRIAGLLGRTRSGWGVALVLASFMFGLSHFGQGVTGVSENFIDGMIIGALYLKFGRNLAVPIIAHGVTDTVDFLL